jgi:hypothetical protein
MATFQERFDMTKRYMSDPDVTSLEALTHFYAWYRFEWAIYMRERYNKIAYRLSVRLNGDLDVYVLRKEMSDL